MEFMHSSILFILGISIFAGTCGSWIFQKLKIPQVIGYLIFGFILGESGFKIITSTQIATLKNFNFFALGIIGFLVGTELKWEILKKHVKQLTSILICEGVFAFILTTAFSTLVIYAVTQNLKIAFSAGVVLGAIASATDPASTINVLWEYKAQGILTTTLISIIALDDALAMTLYALGTSLAQILIESNVDIPNVVLRVFLELSIAVILGVVSGSIINLILKKTSHKENSKVFTIGILLIVISICSFLKLDIILTTMFLGITVANFSNKESESLFDLIKSFSSPIYVIFFVLVGARLTINHMPIWLWLIIIGYVVFRSLGKIYGSVIGAKITKANKNVEKYIGYGLFAQGGVAIGLSIMASAHLQNIMVTKDLSLGNVVIFTVTTTTFIVQLLGPMMVKLAITKSNEIGKNITEEDLIAQLYIQEVMTKSPVLIKINDNLDKILKIISQNEFTNYPVINETGKLIGLINLENLKEIITHKDCWDWVVAEDLMIKPKNIIDPTMNLKNALDFMQKNNFEQLPVVENQETKKPIGILDLRQVMKNIQTKLIEIREY